ncbi:MAG: terminase family protein, partial [Pseudomonadota bacterium]
EGLRGPQFDCAWADELAKWPKAKQAWDMLQFGLRLGDHPQQLVTTTPRSIKTLRDILDSPTTVLTKAATEANRANLASSFLQDIRRRYRNSRLERQELDGVLLESVDGAMWSHDQFKSSPKGADFDRVLVALDPSVSNGPNSDVCGICVVGIHQTGHPTEWTASVLADVSIKPDGPATWAEAVVNAYHDYDAHAVVAEVNQGGDLIVTMVQSIDATVPVEKVHARKSKSRRAEPVALLYDQGRVTHRSGLSDLEDQLCQMTRHGFKGQGSPDRVDALVWALTVGIVVPMQSGGRPGVRRL